MLITASSCWEASYQQESLFSRAAGLFPCKHALIVDLMVGIQSDLDVCDHFLLLLLQPLLA